MDLHEKPQMLAAADDFALKSLQRSRGDLHPIPGLNSFLRSERLATHHELVDASQILVELRLILDANTMGHLIGGQSADASFLPDKPLAFALVSSRAV